MKYSIINHFRMNKYLTKLFITLCLAVSFSVAHAQKFQGNYDLLLHSGQRTLESNINDFIAQPTLSAAETNAAYFYRYLQFDEVPTNNQHEQIAGLGIKLLQYIPHKTYIAAIPTNMDFQALKSINVRAIEVVATNDKLNEYLRFQTYPNWTVEGDEIELVVKLYEAPNRKALLSALLGMGAKVIKIHYRNNLVHIKTRKDDAAIRAIADLPFVNFLETLDPPGEREDTDGRSLQRANLLNEASANGLKFDGAGVKIQVRDDGPVGPHIDFQGRIEMVGATSTGSHGDGVAGVWTGAGNLDEAMAGGASGAFMYVTDYVANFQDTTYGLHLYHGMKVSNSSYSNGCNGGYTTTTQTVDDQIWDSPTLMHVFSAGNSNNNDCGYGAGNQWGNITGGHKMGKNVIATANLNSLGVLETSSSRGPASDGRIKPDMAAYGQGQMSTDENNTYQSFGGTSAAAPSGAGVYTQLLQAYKTMHNGQEPESALLKAVVMNTATDLGNAGPDFRFGWGLYHGGNAYNLLNENRYIVDSVGQGVTKNHTFTIPANTAEARIMVYWMEPAASTVSAIALVNDLDMTVSNGMTTTQPLVLNPAANATTLNNPAVPGVDNLNNVEQVRLANPTAGTYTVNVAGSVVPFGTKKYYVLYEFIQDDIKVTYPNGGEGLDPNKTARIHWDARGTTGNFAIHYSTDNGTSWNLISNNVSGSVRYYNWNVPSSVNNTSMVRVTRGSLSDMSDTTFAIVGTPTGVSVDTVCINGVTVSWNAVAGATSYDVLALGSMYMDSVISTTGTSATFAGDPYADYWVSVRSKINGSKGPRSNAIFKAGGLLNCVLADEVAIDLLSPNGSATGCAADSTLTVQIFNNGNNPQSNIPVSYQLDNNAVVTETVAGPIPAGQSIIYTFNSLLPVTTGVQYNLATWVSLAADPIPYNDTATVQIEFFAAQTLPFSDDFESYGLCGTASDCQLEVCPLGNGWSNNTNGIQDNIDWRVNAGTTPSTATGPSTDHNPGTATGKYLYLESSGGCENQIAELVSPCIDLTGGLTPIFSVWYHMDGATMGELHADILVDGVWTNDFISPLIGAQGSSWKEMTGSLTPYINKTVNIRLRGITGSSFNSDIAIDDFHVFDITQAPVANFTTSQSDACLASAVTFTDQSTLLPSSWQWSFTPNTVSFVNGTTAASQNPAVVFNAVGSYDVKLVATNGIGSDSTTKVGFITVGAGVVGTVTEDFQNAFPSTNWSIGNGDGADTWEQSSGITGIGGTTTLAAYMNNFNYNAVGELDYIYTPKLDLTASTTASLKFDVAYARYSTAFSDGLNVEISTDCGATYTAIYSKSGTTLATVSDQTSSWSPSNATDWRTENIDLTNYVGNSVIIRFVGINGYGNGLFIDNVNIFDPLSVAPTAAYTVSNPPCFSSTTFTSTATGALTWAWDFGPNATPATANTAGPHTVSFATAGAQNVSLTVGNNIGTDVSMQTVTVDSLPSSSFTATAANEVITFANLPTATGVTYFWNFGDGTTSTTANPGTHAFPASGLYTVTLTATNGCGSTSTSATFDIFYTGVTDLAKGWDINIFPNPTTGQFTVALEGITGDVDLSITDVAGKLIRNWNYSNVNTGWKTAIDASELAKGIYILKVQSGNEVKNIKLSIQ